MGCLASKEAQSDRVGNKKSSAEKAAWNDAVPTKPAVPPPELPAVVSDVLPTFEFERDTKVSLSHVRLPYAVSTPDPTWPHLPLQSAFSHVSSTGGYVLMAIFDGCGGPQAASFFDERVQQAFAAALSSPLSVADAQSSVKTPLPINDTPLPHAAPAGPSPFAMAIKQTLTTLDEAFASYAKGAGKAKAASGATCAVAVVDLRGQQVVVGNVGSCHCFLGRAVGSFSSATAEACMIADGRRHRADAATTAKDPAAVEPAKGCHVLGFPSGIPSTHGGGQKALMDDMCEVHTIPLIASVEHVFLATDGMLALLSPDDAAMMGHYFKSSRIKLMLERAKADTPTPSTAAASPLFNLSHMLGWHAIGNRTNGVSGTDPKAVLRQAGRLSTDAVLVSAALHRPELVAIRGVTDEVAVTRMIASWRSTNRHSLTALYRWYLVQQWSKYRAAKSLRLAKVFRSAVMDVLKVGEQHSRTKELAAWKYLDEAVLITPSGNVRRTDEGTEEGEPDAVGGTTPYKPSFVPTSARRSGIPRASDGYSGRTPIVGVTPMSDAAAAAKEGGTTTAAVLAAAAAGENGLGPTTTAAAATGREGGSEAGAGGVHAVATVSGPSESPMHTPPSYRMNKPSITPSPSISCRKASLYDLRRRSGSKAAVPSPGAGDDEDADPPAVHAMAYDAQADDEEEAESQGTGSDKAKQKTESVGPGGDGLPPPGDAVDAVDASMLPPPRDGGGRVPINVEAGQLSSPRVCDSAGVKASPRGGDDSGVTMSTSPSALTLSPSLRTTGHSKIPEVTLLHDSCLSPSTASRIPQSAVHSPVPTSPGVH